LAALAGAGPLHPKGGLPNRELLSAVFGWLGVTGFAGSPRPPHCATPTVLIHLGAGTLTVRRTKFNESRLVPLQRESWKRWAALSPRDDGYELTRTASRIFRCFSHQAQTRGASDWGQSPSSNARCFASQSSCANQAGMDSKPRRPPQDGPRLAPPLAPRFSFFLRFQGSWLGLWHRQESPR